MTIINQIKAIEGEKKGGGGGSAHVATEDPNTIASRAIIRVLEVISEGECVGLSTGDAQSIYFDNTPIQNADLSYNFTNVSYDVRHGLPSQAYMAGFPSAESVVQLGTTLTPSNPVTIQSSNSIIDAVRITVQLSRGLAEYDTATGDEHGSSVTIAFDTRLDSVGTWSQVSSQTITGKNNAAFELDYRIERPIGTGLWSWRVRRLTPTATLSSTINETTIPRYTEIEDVKLEYDYTAYVGIGVNSQSTGNSIPSRSFLWKGIICQIPTNYDPIAKTYAGQWNGTFKRAWTDNPAWVLYDLLTNERYGMGEFVTANIIEKFSFYDASVYNDQFVPTGLIELPIDSVIRQSDGAVLDKNGVLIHTPEEHATERRFTFNTPISTQEDALKVLQAVASTMRSVLMYSEGELWLSQDRPSEPVKLVTNANVIGGKFQRSGSPLQQRNTVARVTWNDKNNKYAATVATVEDDDGIARYGYMPVDVAAYGATTEGQAIRAGKWMIYTSLNTTEIISYSCSFDQFDLRIGNVIKVWDTDYIAKAGAGRIKAAANNSVTLDRPVTITNGAYIDIALADGKIHSLPIIETNGTYTTVTVDGEWALLPLPDNAIYMVTDTIAPALFRVSDLVQEAESIKVTAVEYDPNKYIRIEQGIKITQPVYSTIQNTVVYPVTNITSTTEATTDPIIGTQLKLRIDWTKPTSPYTMGYDVKYRFNNGQFVTDFALQESYTIPNATAGKYEVQVTAVNMEGKKSTTAVQTFTQTYNGSNNLLPPTAILIAPEHGSGTNFISDHLFVYWNYNTANDEIPNQTVGGYRVDVFNSSTGVLLRSETTAKDELFYDYTADKMVKDGGAIRNIRLDIYTLDATLRPSSTSVSTTFHNVAPAVPSNIAATALTSGLSVSFNKPTDSDYVGMLIWLSTTTGFTPSASNLVFDGDSSLITLPNLIANTPYYLRVAAYDSFGKSLDGTGLNLSGEISTTPLSLGIPQATSLPVSASENDVVYLTTDKKLYHYTSGAWVAVVGDILANSITAAKLDTVNAVITGTAQLGAAVVSTAAIQDASITSAKILNVTADKIATGTLGVGTTITVGGGITMSSDGTIVSDGTAKQTVISNGNVITYKKVGASLYPYQSLNHVEMGQATNGTPVTIPGYFVSQPSIIVSPANLQFFNPTYVAQAQSVNCVTGAIAETTTGSMVWQFTPTATLNLAAATNTITVNAGSGDIAANNWTSPTYTMPANCTSITPSVQLKSVLGNGSSQYYYRSIRWRVEYYNGSAWVTTDAFRTVNMGAQTATAQTDTKTFTFPSAAAWQWRIYTEEFNTDGTVFGSVGYTYSQTTVGLGSNGVIYTSPPSSLTSTTPINFGAATGSGEIYQVTYSWVTRVGMSYSSSTEFANGNWVDYAGTNHALNFSWGATDTNFSGSYTTSSYSSTLNGTMTQRGWTDMYNTKLYATVQSGSATIYRRTIVANSTTPTNNSYINSYGYTLTTAQVLATGTLNWLAVGS